MAAEAALGSNRQGVSFRDRRGHGVSCRSVQRTLTAPHLSLHVRSRVHGGCPACSAMADGFNGFAVHLEHHDVAMIAVSRAPIAALQAYKRRMGWTFTWASSLNSDFNYDFNTSFTEEQRALRQDRLQLQYARHDTRLGPSRPNASAPRLFRRYGGHDRHRHPHLHPRSAGHERIRTLRWRHLPHLLHLRARPRRALGNVPVARSGTEWAERNGVVVSAARRVHMRFSIAVAKQYLISSLLYF